MYGYVQNNDPYSSSPDSYILSGSVTPQFPPIATIGYVTSPPALVIPSYEMDSTSSGGYDSPSYTPSNMAIHRTASSNSITTQFHNHGFFNQPISPSPIELLDFEGSNSTDMRRIFSSEDLQGTNMVQVSHSHRSESPISSESNSIIESMINKASRYSPDEKKERIERYRSKKTQRNFTKKIKYVCRKTLADSRPRIRGRFARNEEIEKAMEHECTSQGNEQEGFDYEDDYIWMNMNNIVDQFPPNLIP